MEDPGFGAITSLGGLACKRVLYKAADGEQHLLLRSDAQAVQIRCLGADLAFDPFALELVIDEFPEVEGRQRLIARLAAIYRGRPEKPARWTAQKLWHRDALIALDGWRAGLSQRDIARFLHGDARVERDWRTPDQTLKNRIARAIKRGRALMNGGYRKLLA